MRKRLPVHVRRPDVVPVALRAAVPDALPALGCRCRARGLEPWLERDPVHGLHCTRCGCDA